MNKTCGFNNLTLSMFNTAGSTSSFGKTRPPLAPPDTTPRPLEGAGAAAGAGAGAALTSALTSISFFSTAASTFFSTSAAAFFAASAGVYQYAKEDRVSFNQIENKHSLSRYNYVLHGPFSWTAFSAAAISDSAFFFASAASVYIRAIKS